MRAEHFSALIESVKEAGRMRRVIIRSSYPTGDDVCRILGISKKRRRELDKLIRNSGIVDRKG